MLRRFKRRPSAGSAIAFVALLAALSGTAIALPGSGSVDSGDVKNNTIRSKDLRNNDVRSGDIRNSTVAGRDVKNDSLTGSDVLESSLSTVPSATSAGRASSAGNADSVAGATIRSFRFRSGGTPDPGVSQEILNVNGLRLTATCVLGFIGSTGFTELGVKASTDAADADLVSESRGIGRDGATFGTDDNNTGNDDFSSQDEVEGDFSQIGSFGTGAGDTNDVQLLGESIFAKSGSTTFSRPGGGAVTVQWSASDVKTDCSFNGTAVAG